MAYTQDDIDRLKRAIALGVRRVKYADGREHEYDSLSAMKERLRDMQAEVNPAGAQVSRVVTITNGRDW